MKPNPYMVPISRKEVFECGVALLLNTILRLNNIKDKNRIKITDFILIQREGSTYPILCHQPGEAFRWNGQGKINNENSYVYLPLGRYSDVHLYMANWQNEDENQFHLFEAKNHECLWIRNFLMKGYVQADIIHGSISSWIGSTKCFISNNYFFSGHSKWIQIKTSSDFIVYIPYFLPWVREDKFSIPEIAAVKEKIYEQFNE